MSETYKLYGTDFSLYTGKVRSYLRKKGIPFKEIHSSIKVYKKFIVPRTGVQIVPIVQSPDDEVWQDTTIIIDALEDRFPEISVYPKTPKQKLVSLLLETYGDEWLLIPAMHYRWAYQDVNQPYVFQKFGTIISPKLPKFIRFRLGQKLGDRFRSMVPMLGIKEKSIPAIEASYEQLLADLDCHFQKHDYLLGGHPSIADFGFMGPLYAHLYLDPYPGKYMREHAPAVAHWVERMNADEIATGDFLPDDEIPDTLMPILQRMASEQVPVLLDTDRKLLVWARENPDTEIPRIIGEHNFCVQGVTSIRAILPYSLWMFQRPVDYYQSLSGEQKGSLIKLLGGTGLTGALEGGLQNRLERKEQPPAICVVV